MRMIVQPLVFPLLLLAACKETGPNSAAGPSAPVEASQSSSVSAVQKPVKISPPAVPPSDKGPDVKIVGVAPSAESPVSTREKLLPLAKIIEIARHRVPGEILEVELKDEDGQIEYELEILTDAGRKIEIKIDARQGTVLKVEED